MNDGFKPYKNGQQNMVLEPNGKSSPGAILNNRVLSSWRGKGVFCERNVLLWYLPEAKMILDKAERQKNLFRNSPLTHYHAKLTRY